MHNHRFIYETITREVHANCIGIYAQRTFSKGFQISRNWKGALKIIHNFIWTKINRLRPGVATQEPGQVPEEIVRQLERVITAMPAAKKYNKR